MIVAMRAGVVQVTRARLGRLEFVYIEFANTRIPKEVLWLNLPPYGECAQRLVTHRDYLCGPTLPNGDWAAIPIP